MVAQGRRLSLCGKLVRADRIAAVALLDQPPNGEGAEQNPYGPFVEAEAGGCFRGSRWKLFEEPHLGRGVEGDDQTPVRDLSGRGQE